MEEGVRSQKSGVSNCDSVSESRETKSGLRIGIKNQQVVVSAPHLLHAEIPRIACGLPILFWVFGVPGKTVAHRVHFDSEFFSRDVFAVAVVARLHELNHAAIQPASGSTHHQTQRTRGLSFAVSRVDHQEAARLLLVILTTPLVLFFFGRHLGRQKTEDRSQETEARRLILTPVFCLLTSIP